MSEETEKPLTVTEFKAWLEGVEEMQEDSWTPSPAQWVRIREKIAKLCLDLETGVAMHVRPNGPVLRGHSVPLSSFPSHNDSALSTLSADQVASAPQQSTLSAPVQPRVPAQHVTQQSEINIPQAPISQPGPVMGDSGQTPTVDTPPGPYISSFE